MLCALRLLSAAGTISNRLRGSSGLLLEATLEYPVLRRETVSLLLARLALVGVSELRSQPGLAHDARSSVWAREQYIRV